MTLRRRVVIAVIATLVVALVGGGVGTGLSLAQQQRAANRSAQPASQRPAAATTSPVPVATHGLVGRIVTVEGDRLLIRDQQRRLREVRLVAATVVRREGKRIDHGLLAPGDRIAAVGQPGPERALIARLITVGPATTPRPAPRQTP